MASQLYGGTLSSSARLGRLTFFYFSEVSSIQQGLVDMFHTIWQQECSYLTSVICPQREGKIPEWLEGRLIQNGPGKFSFGSDVFNHLFDGSALLQQFTIKNGEATYMCRCVFHPHTLSRISAIAGLFDQEHFSQT